VLLSDTGDAWRSTDSGRTFAPVLIGHGTPGYDKYRSFAFDPENPDVVYAGRDNNNTGSGFPHVFKSVDRGASWEVKSTGLSDSDSFRTAGLCVDPRNDGWVYAVETYGLFGGVNQLWVSHDGGETWSVPVALPDRIVALGDVLTFNVDPLGSVDLEVELFDTTDMRLAESLELIEVTSPPLGTLSPPVETADHTYRTSYTAGSEDASIEVVVRCERCVSIQEVTFEITVGTGSPIELEDGGVDGSGEIPGPPSSGPRPEGCGCRVARPAETASPMLVLALCILIALARRQTRRT
jgi:hypothetical protein